MTAAIPRTTTGPRLGGSRFASCRRAPQRPRSRRVSRFASQKLASGFFRSSPAPRPRQVAPQLTRTHQENSVTVVTIVLGCAVAPNRGGGLGGPQPATMGPAGLLISAGAAGALTTGGLTAATGMTIITATGVGAAVIVVGGISYTAGTKIDQSLGISTWIANLIESPPVYPTRTITTPASAMPNRVDALVIGKIPDLAKPTNWQAGDYILAPGVGGYSWPKNEGLLLGEMAKGQPIRDTNPFDNTGALGKEHQTLRDAGWTNNGGVWVAPKK
jgi:hypothetical protein